MEEEEEHEMEEKQGHEMEEEYGHEMEEEYGHLADHRVRLVPRRLVGGEPVPAADLRNAAPQHDCPPEVDEVPGSWRVSANGCGV